MRRPVLAATLLVAAFASTPAARAADDRVSGTWLVSGKVGAFAFTLSCEFHRRGETIDGVCYDGGTRKAHPLTEGYVAGPSIGWTYQSSFMFKPFDAVYSGVIQDGAIKGSITVPGYAGVFTANKQP